MFYSKNIYGTPFQQENLGEIQTYRTSLEVHHGHFRGLFLLFIAFLLKKRKRKLHVYSIST